MSIMNSSVNNGGGNKRENAMNSGIGNGLNGSQNVSQANINPKNKKRVH